MNKTFNRSLLIGFGFSILILLLTGVVSYTVLNRTLESNRLVTHSTRIMQNLEQLLSDMKDAETGQRGYLLTGKKQFLEPYRGAAKNALALSADTRRLTADNPVQQSNLTLIRQVLVQRLDILQRLIDQRDKGVTISENDLDEGKQAMDALRSAVAKAEADEQRLLKERTEQLNHYAGMAPGFIIAALSLAVVIAVLSYIRVIRDMQQKDRLYGELHNEKEETAALNEELTAANEEITAGNEELTSINEELVGAREELVRANESLEEKVQIRTKALQDREAETQALNEELTATNEELVATNEELAESQQELIRMIEELRIADERSAKLAAIVESSDDAIIGKDLNGVVTAWNRGAEQIFGYTESEIVGQSILTLIPEDLHHEEPVILDKLRNGEKIDHYETIRRTQDGRLIDVSLTISPIKDKEGRVIGVSKIARDITEQKRNEQRKNDFIGMASHELKTPLTSLTGLIQVLELRAKSGTDAFAMEALGKANFQARRMAALINGFLNVSRLESGKLVIEKSRFDLTELIREMVAEIRLTVSKHIFVFDPAAEVQVEADRDKIGSVISNLLSNAIKYSPKGELVTIELQGQADRVQVSVRDEGMGIKAADLPKIFDRYYRVQSDHTRHIAGFGVGLYLSAEIIEHHGGRIWAESEPGVGSTFYFSLPLI